MHTAPAMTITSDVTVEKTGRLMKKSANKAGAPSPYRRKLLLDLDSHAVRQVLSASDYHFIAGL